MEGVPFCEEFEVVLLEVLLFELSVDFAECEESGDFHLILGESAGFIGANGVCASHGFAGFERADEVLLVFHFADGVRECNRNGEGETFRDGDDDDRDTDDEEANDFLEILKGEEFFASGLASEDQVDDHCAEGEDRAVESDLADLIDEHVKLDLQGRLLFIVVFLHHHLLLANARLLANREHEHLATPFDDFRSRNQERTRRTRR